MVKPQITRFFPSPGEKKEEEIYLSEKFKYLTHYGVQELRKQVFIFSGASDFAVQQSD